MNLGTYCALCLVCSAAGPVCFATEPIQIEASQLIELRTHAAAVEIEMSDLRADITAYYIANDSSTLLIAEHELLLRELSQLEVELTRLNEQLGSDNIAYITDDGLVSRGSSAYGGHSPPTPTVPPLLSLQDNLGDQSGLEISGFMDAVYENNTAQTDRNDAYLNQVEVDITRKLNPRAAASLGIIYADGFQVGVAEIAYQIKPESNSNYYLLKSWNAAAGQFDAPFGEDVASYASNARKSISIPDIVVETHNLWNDVGVKSSWSFSFATVDAWAVRGFPLQSNTDLDEPENELNVSGGARLNVEFADCLRAGGSCASGWLRNGEPAMQLYGAHCVLSHGGWSVIGEGIILEENVRGAALERRGYYVQAIRQLGHFFALSRADYVDGSGYPVYRYYSLGGGANLGSGLELRSEYRIDQDGANNQGLIQIVATF